MDDHNEFLIAKKLQHWLHQAAIQQCAIDCHHFNPPRKAPGLLGSLGGQHVQITAASPVLVAVVLH